jgi:hypothetical protein
MGLGFFLARGGMWQLPTPPKYYYHNFVPCAFFHMACAPLKEMFDLNVVCLFLFNKFYKFHNFTNNQLIPSQ